MRTIISALVAIVILFPALAEVDCVNDFRHHLEINLQNARNNKLGDRELAYNSRFNAAARICQSLRDQYNVGKIGFDDQSVYVSLINGDRGLMDVMNSSFCAHNTQGLSLIFVDHSQWARVSSTTNYRLMTPRCRFTCSSGAATGDCF